jgi:hypothetical protein
MQRGRELIEMKLLRRSRLVTLCAVRLSSAATAVCPEERFAATDPQGQKIRLRTDELMRRVVKKTNLTFPMLDGGHLRGTVELDVVIDRTGKVACANVVSGHPIAAASAMASIPNWRFQPFVLLKKRLTVTGRLSIPYDVEGFRATKSN